MTHVKWITFDLDGTLMQNPFGKWVFPEISRLCQQDLRSDLYRLHQERMRNKQYVAAYDWQEMLEIVLREKGLDLDIDVESLVLKHSVIPKVHLLEEDIPSALQSLSRRGYALAVMTNGFEIYQLPVLKALGIDGYFDCIITPEKVGTAKPDVGMADALKRMGTLIAHVGDRIDHDVIFANDLGIASVLVWREMPEALRRHPPEERVRTDEGNAYVLAKWREETGDAADQSSAVPAPDLLIYSIQELICLKF